MSQEDHQRDRPNNSARSVNAGPRLKHDQRRKKPRATDQRFHECADKYTHLIQTDYAITSELNVDALFRIISHQISCFSLESTGIDQKLDRVGISTNETT